MVRAKWDNAQTALPMGFIQLSWQSLIAVSPMKWDLNIMQHLLVHQVLSISTTGSSWVCATTFMTGLCLVSMLFYECWALNVGTCAVRLAACIDHTY